ncbi:FAST kinase domain-containing protein 1, mitochondrial [Nematolebias whitei]|uniref:FAST kinase domain-containing protein 1, mitochondrial n=1 Tax=Nematolebias whitei TaxID=451745 RepID=UPI00189A18DD|nr:FAST kinase domain-containing protein 1, mitochondrial [Nematolebias whitei]
MRMFRLRCVNPCLRRLLHLGAVNRDQVLEGLQVCSSEDQVFDVVSKNKAKLTVDHVSCAVKLLWQFQKNRPELIRNIDHTNSHPQFHVLKSLAENQITLMDDLMLVDTMYAFFRLNVEPHKTLLQQMVSEVWLRIDRLPMSSLSKFAVMLTYQHHFNSPLMGRIASILDQKLYSIDEIRVLAPLMNSVSNLVSPRLQDALMSRLNQLLNTGDSLKYSTLRKAFNFMYITKYIDQSLLEKYNKIFLCEISIMDVEMISIIMNMYQKLHFKNYDFILAAKERLTELMDTSTDPFSFCKLFVTLAPIASTEVRGRLEGMALLLADEFSARQILAITEALAKIKSRNFSLLNKIGLLIQKDLHAYNSVDIAKITQALICLHYQNSQLFAVLRTVLLRFLQSAFYPSVVAKLIQVLSMLPSPWLIEGVVSRVDEVIPQCNLSDLIIISVAVSKQVQNDPFYCHNTHSKYIRLLQRLSHCSRERLQTADQLDLVLYNLKSVSGAWFREMLVEDTIITLNRMIDQINWNNVSECAFFLAKMDYLHRPLLDRIASVAVEHIDKIHFSAVYDTLLPFSHLNYEPAQAEELYDACIKHFTPHISAFDPRSLVLLAFSLAVAGHFPEELVKEIFSVDFLRKLDGQLDSLSYVIAVRIRQTLMELNRALCLECPQFQVPWFHEHYCQQLKRKGNGTVSPVQQQIHKMLGEVLGGINFVQVAVVTPYFCTVDFECKLDKYSQPLCYWEPSSLLISSKGKDFRNSGSPRNIRDELPPGAQCVAVDFLDSRFFCKNSHHIKGNALMKKRHLEILGYRVIQIPHFEWNSMELSTHDAWKDYLRKKIFG